MHRGKQSPAFKALHTFAQGEWKRVTALFSEPYLPLGEGLVPGVVLGLELLLALLEEGAGVGGHVPSSKQYTEHRGRRSDQGQDESLSTTTDGFSKGLVYHLDRVYESLIDHGNAPLLLGESQALAGGVRELDTGLTVGSVRAGHLYIVEK